ncbi:MAG: hypothetical protein GX344_12285 [Intrasporangiaceae bacterium]|nr:hypothetical protein [Intrasporangiaceae bacterium]
MKRNHVIAALVLGATLVVTGCGFETVDPGADTPGDPTSSADPTDSVSSDNAGGGAANGGAHSSDGLLADTTGDSPFYIDSVDVTVAESWPVQLFLTVHGNAPTPAHTVAYTVEQDGDTIAVHLTTQAGEGVAPQVLKPHEIVIPLGTAELPVTIDVNDGEFTETVEG